MSVLARVATWASIIALTSCAGASFPGGNETLARSLLPTGALNGSCATARISGESLVNYIVRSRRKSFGGTIDIDCVIKNYSRREIVEDAASGVMMASYVLLVEGLSRGGLCESPVRRELLQLSRNNWSLFQSNGDFRMLVPDSAYVSGAIAEYCGDIPLATEQYRQSVRTGFLEAEVDWRRLVESK